jgi:lactoylglutathione lyase
MIRNVNAVVLFVQDFETSLAFYRDALGLEVAVHEPEFAAFRMHDQDFALNPLAKGADMVGLDISAFGGQPGHMARAMLCATVDDVDTLYTQYKANGVPFIKAPVDRYWGYRTAYFRDPDGNIWELRQPIAQQ